VVTVTVTVRVTVTAAFAVKLSLSLHCVYVCRALLGYLASPVIMRARKQKAQAKLRIVHCVSMFVKRRVEVRAAPRHRTLAQSPPSSSTHLNKLQL
jgi:hypothetical protein